jgi:exopolysaccharide biosynthesis protein
MDRTLVGRAVRTLSVSVLVMAMVTFIEGASSSAAPLHGTTTAAKSALTNSGDDSHNGLRVFTMNGRRFRVATAIHVLSFSGPQYQVKIHLANRAIDKGVQTPSSMCQSTAGCVAAVNGDFFNLTPTGELDPGDAVGGIIQNCVLLHTPQISHQQVNLDGQSVSQGLNWSSTLTVNGVDVPITGINQQLPMSYANVHLPLTGTLLFTPRYAPGTPSATGRMTFEFMDIGGAKSPTTINTTARLELVSTTAQADKVTGGYVDISAPTDSPLSSLQVGDIATLTTTSNAGCDSIGGHPILMDHGVAIPVVRADTYMAKPFARTVIGWTAAGRTILMTVDGKDGVSGATAHQLVGLLQALHVVTALDLDGGNSTTFYAQGRVLNHPSRGKERPVSTGLLVIRNPA